MYIVKYVSLFYRYLCREDNQDDQFNLQYRGPVIMKGKSEPMKVWFLTRANNSVLNQTVLSVFINV